jgi:hypothetical protein
MGGSARSPHDAQVQSLGQKEIPECVDTLWQAHDSHLPNGILREEGGKALGKGRVSMRQRGPALLGVVGEHQGKPSLQAGPLDYVTQSWRRPARGPMLQHQHHAGPETIIFRQSRIMLARHCTTLQLCKA